MHSGQAFGGGVPDWLSARAAMAPDRLAIASGDERVTFAELDRRADAVARRLAGHGIAPGDRVAVMLPNGLPMVELVHGAGRAGAVLVPLNLRLAPAETAWQLADVRARLIIGDRARLAALPQPGGDVTTPLQPGSDVTTPLQPGSDVTTPLQPGSGLAVLDAEQFAALSEADLAPRRQIDLSAVHTIIYTSGTTGRPKGALLTYGNHWWSAIGSALNLGLRDDDRWLAVLPLFHVGGLSILMRGAIYGVPVIVHDGFDPAAVNAAIDAEGVTHLSLVTAALRRVLEQRGARPFPPTLRHVLLGGGPVPEPLLRECVRLGLPVVQTYGLTETASQAVTLAPQDAVRKLGSAGRPLLPTELRVVREGSDVGADEDGEIELRGPTVTPGYADRPAETAAAIQDGWLRTGDIGRLDADGYLYVLDRRRDLIVSGGENVYPAEIEAVLAAHHAVAEAGVTGTDDARWGRVPIAFVVPRDGHETSPAELLAWCGERLARYKVPTRISIVASLPRNAAGKLLRDRLGTDTL